MGIGMRELIVILLVVLVIFGAKKLRNIGSDLGAAVKGFKDAMNEGERGENVKQIKAEARDAEFPEVTQTPSSDKANRPS
jgi:sec-independent protein translocase protein TatA